MGWWVRVLGIMAALAKHTGLGTYVAIHMQSIADIDPDVSVEGHYPDSNFEFITLQGSQLKFSSFIQQYDCVIIMNRRLFLLIIAAIYCLAQGAVSSSEKRRLLSHHYRALFAI